VAAAGPSRLPTARRRFRLAGAALALLAMLLASGSHWIALQGLAFGRMIVRYAQDAPLAEAVARTFDGKHPCPLCHAVQEGRQNEEKKRSTFGPQSRLELGLPGTAVAAPRWNVSAQDRPAAPPRHWHARAEAPPKPRPRAG
jgi:hypothetical protein